MLVCSRTALCWCVGVFQDDKPISTTDQRIQTDFKDEKATLRIDKATSADTGTYTMSAGNAAGEDETDVVVEVTGTP